MRVLFIISYSITKICNKKFLRMKFVSCLQKNIDLIQLQCDPLRIMANEIGNLYTRIIINLV